MEEPWWRLRFAQVVITGSSRGLGYALADQFLAFGDDVIVSSRTEQACLEAAEKLTQKYPARKVLSFPCDVRNADEAVALARFAQEKLGRLDIWVNNAGVSQVHKSELQETSPEVLEQVLATNLLGSIYGARAALQVFSEQENGGKLFFIDGTGSWGNATPGNVAYGASKRAITQLKASLVAETKKEREIAIHIASPGMVATELLLGGDRDARASKFINILAEDASTVAAWMVPRMRGVRGSGKYFKFLTTRGVIWRFLTAKGRKGRFLP
ncbi:NAD(P)-binding protein [Coccomyxa subellipsoidea C-169]|uniref:NAD(P)-binding protein n=1 Tax=Coccomyxa subellipsoidea (strain C-169) TaxID=574566 RepID=I0Z2Z9_COCSC|nr:NAD(P)-binding protein [Coccomyxa subellipsoidea C-169]EIE25018.1 NAD(P)-binding protein [Coccomyxa subellipsoidea C-169]|eukprot:XP_005649562.1 NAD(P)-binding protein [Coccomyxa subellipsoidea C-169]